MNTLFELSHLHDYQFCKCNFALKTCCLLSSVFPVCTNSIVNAIFLPYSMYIYATATAVEKPRPSGNPCINNPCGPFSQCRAIGDTPACSCLPNYVGRAPNCRPECVISAECPSNLACINQKCSDPCVGACGAHTYCTATNHNSICQCEPGYTGDPFSICTEIRKCKLDSFVSIHCIATLLYLCFHV